MVLRWLLSFGVIEMGMDGVDVIVVFEKGCCCFLVVGKRWEVVVI